MRSAILEQARELIRIAGDMLGQLDDGETQVIVAPTVRVQKTKSGKRRGRPRKEVESEIDDEENGELDDAA